MATIKDLNKNAALVSWTNREDLFSVSFDGLVTIYSMYGVIKQTFHLDQEIRDTKVLECQDFLSTQGTGIAIITSSFRFFTVNNLYDARVRRLPEVPGLASAPTCWRVISQSRDTQILVGSGSSLYLLRASDKTCTPMNIVFSVPYTNILDMAVNFDSSKIAVFADNGYLWLGSLRNGLFDRNCEFNIKSKKKADQLVWAGTEAVIGLWKNVLMAVGLENDWFSQVIDTPVILAEEVDGLRIIGHFTHEFLQRVPDITHVIFSIGSVSAGSLLLEAAKEFEKRTHKADEYIKILRDRDEIDVAVEQCIQAAGHEMVTRDQKALLRAAAFGKNFSPESNRDRFVNMCQTLRVLNAIRDQAVAIPLTYVQLELLSMKVLIDRLILRRHYALAIKISDFLKIPENEGRLRILGNWASNKVQETHYDDEEVASIIYSKLQLTSGISYSDIASQAIQHGRKQLAIRLLNYETRASQQVPLLLLLDQHIPALIRAIESGDTHLIYTVIYRLKESMSPREFSMTIRNYPEAYALYQKLCRQEDPEKLRDLHYQEDDFNAEAVCWVIESYDNPKFEQRLSCLRSAADSFKKARNDFAAQMTENQLKLLKYQEKLQKTMRINCVDDSVHKTIEKLIVYKEYKLAEELKKEFKVPDRRFWWVKIMTLAAQNEWIELEKFSKSKRSPIGYEVGG